MRKHFYLSLIVLVATAALSGNQVQKIISVKEFKDKTCGCIFGAALGDMLGAPVEFIASRTQINTAYPPSGIIGIESLKEKDFKRDSLYNRYAPYTDDTAMALCVLQGITNSHKLEINTCMQEIAVEFIINMHAPDGWAYAPRAPGLACLKNVKKIEAIYNQQKTTASKNNQWWKGGLKTDGGCGSVMRAHPFGILFHQDPEKAAQWAVMHSEITHGAPIAKAACAALATGVALAIHNEDPKVIVDQMVQAANCYDSKTGDMIQKAHRYALDSTKTSDEVFQELQGWAAHEAIAAAAYIFIKHPNDLKAAIVLGVNTPGDSDSIASIAGALVGARVGSSQVPQSWMHVLENRSEIQKTIDGFIQKIYFSA